MRRSSLIRRMTLLVVVIIVALGVVAIAAGSYTIRRELNESMDTSLQETARRLVPIVVDDLYGREVSPLPRALARPNDSGRHPHELILQVRDRDGRVLMHSDNAPPTPLTEIMTPGFVTSGDWRIYTLDAISGTIFVQVGQPLDIREEETLEAISGFALPTAIFVPLGGLLAWLTVAYTLRPVARLRREIADRGGATLAAVDAASLPPELAGIARSVNRLMRRLSLALDAEREFTANAAHELRTPVAGALAQTERLIEEAPDPTVQARTLRIRESLTGLASLTEKLLQLARADAGLAITGVSTDLASTIRLVVEEFVRREHNEGRIRLALPADGRFRVAIDPDAFAILLRNLIENALIHGPPHGAVDIATTEGCLSVRNEGPTLPPGHLARLTTRFHRGETPGVGTGLGLAIVDRIARQAGAALVLHSPATGQKDGFEAVVRFP